MKANRKVQAPKRTRAPKSGKLLLNDKKPRTWNGFAPDLCGIMSGPRDLSQRKGLHGLDSLAGSLGTIRPSVSIEKMKQGAKAAMAQAGRKALRAGR